MKRKMNLTNRGDDTKDARLQEGGGATTGVNQEKQ
jgi:hypothetical protein